ncbi:DUF423 domain-containing protein [Mucilaginibacter ginkgonis]|uniref:DUF423 domain-containing protein n=1 Tax=Mucilaginibacter ginkgonis TaxID=2682091 RepID=A0A6I4I1X1_9SPHI|nr:DUF423 domain-containing protein [Mucilaginibacter ginkgonis]QQL50619.1 DUF423 domain-containing protein [Mucilaginibacter ginkgonis]
MSKSAIITGALLGAIAVITGAFGAHGLKAILTTTQLETWHTAVQYHFYHVFAILFLSTFKNKESKLIFASYWLFLLGIVFFCGSLYLLSCIQVLGWPWLRIMGPITPVGGLLFIAGWITLAIAAVKER